MSKTPAYLGVISIVIVGLAGVVVLTVFDKDTAPLISLFTTTLPIAITAGVTFYSIDKVKAQTAKIAKSVNGNTSTLLELATRNNLTVEEQHEIARIENENRDLIAGKHAAS